MANTIHPNGFKTLMFTLVRYLIIFNRDVSVLAAGSDESDSESESEENGVIGASGSSDNSATESKNSAGLTNGSITDDTDDEDEEKEETIPVTNGALETEADPKKVSWDKQTNRQRCDIVTY